MSDTSRYLLGYCSVCGEPVYEGDDYEICSDCGAIFCEDCTEDLDTHECEVE